MDSLHKVGNPAAYLLPDVTANFSEAKIEEIAENTVRVSGITGIPPTNSLKLGKTRLDGFRTNMAVYFGGRDAQDKALATGQDRVSARFIEHVPSRVTLSRTP